VAKATIADSRYPFAFEQICSEMNNLAEELLDHRRS